MIELVLFSGHMEGEEVGGLWEGAGGLSTPSGLACVYKVAGYYSMCRKHSDFSLEPHTGQLTQALKCHQTLANGLHVWTEAKVGATPKEELGLTLQ